MRPRFFNQKIEQNEPEKNIPSTQAKATNRFAKLFSGFIHFKAQFPFFEIHGNLVRALKSLSFSISSLM